MVAKTRIKFSGLALSAVLVAAVPAAAQIPAAQSPSIQTPNITAPPVPAQAAQRPPVARQIEPMVAPVRRVSPNTAKAIAPAVPPRAVPQSATLLAPPAAALSATPQTTTAIAPTVNSPSAPRIVSGVAKAIKPVVRLLEPVRSGVATKAAKLVAYTCKIGQNYSLERKSCVTPGVSRVARTQQPSRASKSTQARAPIDTSTRSSLGLKPKQ